MGHYMRGGARERGITEGRGGRRTITVCEEPAAHPADGRCCVRDGEEVEGQVGAEVRTDGADGQICQDLRADAKDKLFGQ